MWKHLTKNEEPNQEPENQESTANNITEFGQLNIPEVKSDIHVINIIGQIEGHIIMAPQNKTTRYEHIMPQLVAAEQSDEVKGILFLLNTVGGDV